MSERKGILERLAEGPVVGDGGTCRTLEKRGYCKAGPWTPEAVIEFPDAVLQLHREFVRSGSDVIQTATFYSSDEKLKYGATDTEAYTMDAVNEAACRLARQAADEGGCLVCGGVCPLGIPGAIRESSVAGFEKQAELFAKQDVDFVMAEFFYYIDELEICADVLKKKLQMPIALSMAIGPAGDQSGVSLEECTVRMARTGADIIGTNCKFDPNTQLKIMKRMKTVLEKENLHPYLVCQPFGFLCPETEDSVMGAIDLPEHPLAMEPRVPTRIEIHRFAREAYELGVNYIGGCCGFESHHIRAIAQELAPERGKVPPCDEKCPAFGRGYELSVDLRNRVRSNRDYWYGVSPGFGRPHCPVVSKSIGKELYPDVSQFSKDL